MAHDMSGSDAMKLLQAEELQRLNDIKAACKGLPDEKERMQSMLTRLDEDIAARRAKLTAQMKRKQPAKKAKKLGELGDSGGSGGGGGSGAGVLTTAADDDKAERDGSKRCHWKKRCNAEPQETWDTMADAVACLAAVANKNRTHAMLSNAHAWCKHVQAATAQHFERRIGHVHAAMG